MKLEWDEEKNEQNLAKHGIGFGAIKEADFSSIVSFEDTRKNYGEVRYLAYVPIRGRTHTLILPIEKISCALSASERQTAERRRNMKKHLTDEDYDAGYMTNEELEKAEFKPFSEMFPDFYAAWQAGEVKIQGRPMLPNKKVPISLRVEPQLLEAMKASGKNWQQKARDALSKTFL